MPSSAATESNIAAAAHSTPATHKHASHTQHDPAEASDAETEPLPYDEDDDQDQDAPADDVMDLNDLAQHAAAASVIPDDVDAPGEPADVSMEHSIESQLEPSQAEDLADAQGEDDDDDDDDDAQDALPASQLTATNDPHSNMSSPQKTGRFTGDEFSDESELTDEDDDQNQDEDGSSLSDDDLGGSDDDEEEEEEEGDDDEDEDDDANSKTHEDEAAEALAALTGGADGADDDAGAAAGLDALAALATAGEADADHDQDGEEDDEEDVSDQEGGSAPATSSAAAPKPGRLHQLRQQVDADDLSSDITPEPEDDEGADAAHADDASDQEDAGSPRETDLDLIASMKKRAAATGGATSLLEPEQLVDSLPGSASSSRAATPDEDDADKADAADAHDADADADGDAQVAQADQAEGQHPDTAAGTPAPDAAEHDDDASTDEAAIRRQEAMEALTKIEIGFAMLRDRLYVERLQEISKEGEMILDGTHPELLHLTKAIETRKQRRTELVEFWFEHQEKQYERVAKAEEFAAWSIWRSSCASLRRDMMDEFSRKRRRLDREKRTLDAPRPARRHQIFETELVRNPDRLHIPLESSQAEDAERSQANGSRAGRKQSVKRKALAREIEAGDEYVAYPDLKGLAEADVMMDIEQMGIRPAGMPPGMYDPFYAAPVGLEFQNPEMYAMYGPEAAAAAAAAAAQAHMNGMQYGLPPGARGMPPPPPGAMMAPGTPGSVHASHRHGMHPLPPPPGHMHSGMEMGMMGFDPYAAAEMERAARMHHREQQARMGMDPNDPHHRSSPFPPDMYQAYPPHFNIPLGAGGPGPGMNAGGRGGMGKMPPSPTPPHRGSNGSRKERGSVEDGVQVSGRGRGAAKTSGGRSKQSRSSQAVSPSGKGKTSLPPPPSMAVEEHHSNGAVRGHPMMKPGFARGGAGGAPAATPVATAAAAGVGNGSLYPSE